MSTPDRVVFDFPTGFAVMRETDPQQHHENCSYRTQNRALLCDCAAIKAADVAWQMAHRRAAQDQTPPELET